MQSVEHNLNKYTFFYMRSFTTVLLLVFSVITVYAQQKIELKFNKEKKFKIAQFTDIHWDDKSEKSEGTIETIQFVLQKEKPDLAILTGDIVTSVSAKEGWSRLANVFVEAKIPWAVTLGNHDAEPDITREEIFDLLETLPYFVGSKGNDLYGCGNYTLNIKSADHDKTASVIYCFDSNAYNTSSSVGGYDWIHFDQIAWYRKTSQQLTAANDNSPLPSLSYFHIPIPEYNYIVEKETTIGEKYEGIASAKINSGIFASMFEMKDIMGVFVGHDHDNNYIGIHANIALAFGQVTGASAYGKLERGSRIVELKEGGFSFDTWITTPSETKFKYNYPSGLEHDNKDVNYLKPVKVENPKQGINYKYFEGEFESTREVSKVQKVKSGVMENISLAPADKDDGFALEFEGYIKIDKKGVYRFYTYSDDGSTLYIDDQLVVDNDGSHSIKRENGKVGLEKGFHKFKLIYFEDHMGNVLEVGLSSISLRETTLQGTMLFINE